MCYNSLAFRPHQLTRDRNLSFKFSYYWEYAFNRPREISDRELERLGRVHLIEAKWWAFFGPDIYYISAQSNLSLFVLIMMFVLILVFFFYYH